MHPSGGFDTFGEALKIRLTHRHGESISQYYNLFINSLIEKLVTPLSMVGCCMWCEIQMSFMCACKLYSEINYLINFCFLVRKNTVRIYHLCNTFCMFLILIHRLSLVYYLSLEAQKSCFQQRERFSVLFCVLFLGPSVSPFEDDRKETWG